MNPAWIAAILGSTGVGAIIAAIVTGMFSKRKLGAEATDIITKAAAGLVTNLQTEIDRQIHLRQEQAERHEKSVNDLIQSHSDEMDEVRRVFRLHSIWDTMAIAKMAEVGIDLPPAPPLLLKPIPNDEEVH